MISSRNQESTDNALKETAKSEKQTDSREGEQTNTSHTERNEERVGRELASEEENESIQNKSGLKDEDGEKDGGGEEEGKEKREEQGEGEREREEGERREEKSGAEDEACGEEGEERKSMQKSLGDVHGMSFSDPPSHLSPSMSTLSPSLISSPILSLSENGEEKSPLLLFQHLQNVISTTMEEEKKKRDLHASFTRERKLHFDFLRDFSAKINFLITHHIEGFLHLYYRDHT
jgi:hypothetical protein